MLPAATAEHYRDQQRLAVATLATVRRLWTAMGVDFDASWSAIAGRLLIVAQAAQLGSVRQGAAYVPAVLAETGQVDDPAGDVLTAPIVGVAADGRSLEGLLYGAVTTAKAAVGNGASPELALRSGGRWLDMATTTMVSDASRDAVGVAIAARPGIGGYVRMLNAPSCPRCTVLAGKFYRWNAGFLRHPSCFPAGVAVSGPARLATTRRRYEGELVVLRTASGEHLPITGNHPVLTDRGWVPANLLQPGDELIRSTLDEGATPLVVPDERQVPSRIEDLWRPNGMVTFRDVPSAAEDFHGDGGHGEVDVVLADRLLRHGELAAVAEPLRELGLGSGSELAALLDCLRVVEQLLGGPLASSSGSMRGGSLSTSFVGAHLRGAYAAGCGSVASYDAGGAESRGDDLPRDAVELRDFQFTGSTHVCGHDVVDRQESPSPRWDAPAGPRTMQNAVAYASRGQDLLGRLAGQVTRDRVVDVSRIEWSGHVFNLTSAEGWFTANGLIVSNCDCRHIPSSENVAGDFRTDPRAAVEAGQVTGLSRADTTAIVEDGADVSKVINSTRGMYSAAGRKLTREGARRVARPRPEQIYRDATDRADAVRLLQRFGYLT